MDIYKGQGNPAEYGAETERLGERRYQVRLTRCGGRSETSAMTVASAVADR
ncbi:hypothetical protein [Streptosporangium roseum]|uniref:hypothetical protein n=1 Tax=Streptosporangium roseum TaxID=2001 RepID=UPI00332DA682